MADYYPIIFDVQSLNTNAQPMSIDPKSLTKCDNWSFGQDSQSTKRFGVLVKNNAASTGAGLATVGESGRCRGLYEFYPSTWSAPESLIMLPLVTTDYTAGKMYFHNYNPTAAWTAMLDTDVSSTLLFAPNHFSFSQVYDSWRVVNTLFMSNASIWRKYFNDNIEGTDDKLKVACNVYDIGGTALDITGTVTFTKSDKTVTSDTDFPSGVMRGAWIRLNSAAGQLWYEVEEDVSAKEITLRNAYGETTGDSTTAQYAPVASGFPLLINHWKSRNWAANFTTGYTGVDEKLLTDGVNYLLLDVAPGTDKLLLSQGNDNSAALVKCSAIMSSVTPAAGEDWSGTDTGEINAILEGIGYVSAIAWLNEYYFIFGENEYIAYRYSSDLLPPLTEVNREGNGCNSHKTIQVIDDTLYYFTGKGVRATNGFSDVSISSDIDFDIRNKCYVLINAKYFSSTATDNAMPTSFYDSFNKQYHLYLSSKASPATVRFDFCYDIATKKWVSGPVNAQNVSEKIESIVPYTSTELIQGRRSFYFPAGSGDTLYEVLLQKGLTALNTAGDLQSADLWFSNISKRKRVNYVEFWVHCGLSQGVTFDFNYEVDGVSALATAIQETITNTSASDYDHLGKLKFMVNAECFNFKWNLSDTAWVNTNPVALVGGIIEYETINASQ